MTYDLDIVIKVHVRAKFHPAKSSASEVVATTEKNSDDAKKQYCRRFRR